MDELTSAIPAHLMGQKPEEIKPKNTMGKDDFMRLLMVQLQNQDPLNPMDHKEFGAQLAQFGQLEQLTNISGGIEKMQTGMGGEAKLQAVGMIGKSIVASGKEATLVAGQPIGMKIDSTENARPVKVSIFDGEGRLVREMPVNARSDKDSLVWDGKTNDGVAAPEGTYTFRVSAVGSDGKAKEVDPTVKGEVVGVELEGNSPVLLVKTEAGKTRIQMDKIRNVGTEAKPAQAPGVEASKQHDLPEMMRRSIPVTRVDASASEEAPSMEEGGSVVWHSDPFVASNLGRGR